jgi:hypothetical protein
LQGDFMTNQKDINKMLLSRYPSFHFMQFHTQPT